MRKSEIIKIIEEFFMENNKDVIQEFGNWKNALNEANISTINLGELRYTDEYILNALKEFYLQQGGKISDRKYKREGRNPSLSTIYRRFGTWNNALKEAGIPTTEKVKKVSKEEILEELKLAYKENTGKFTIEKYSKWAEKNKKTTFYIIRDRFGSWKKALESADIPNQRQIGKPSEKDGIESLKDAYEKIGEPFIFIRYREWAKENERIGARSIQNIFGTWSRALEKAGIR